MYNQCLPRTLWKLRGGNWMDVLFLFWVSYVTNSKKIWFDSFWTNAICCMCTSIRIWRSIQQGTWYYLFLKKKSCLGTSFRNTESDRDFVHTLLEQVGMFYKIFLPNSDQLDEEFHLWKCLYILWEDMSRSPTDNINQCMLLCKSA